MEPITFYRRMANSNIILMKKYKYSQIKKYSYDQILEIYNINKIDLDLDIIRLKKFINGETNKIDIEDIQILKNQTEDVEQLVNTEDGNQLVNTEDGNQLVNTEDGNQLVNTEDVDQLVNTEEPSQNTKYIEEYINIENQHIKTEDTTIKTEDTTIKTEDTTIKTKDTNIKTEDVSIKPENYNFNIYYALLLIPMLAFFLFVKK